jgi:hypothetical protein
MRLRAGIIPEDVPVGNRHGGDGSGIEHMFYGET